MTYIVHLSQKPTSTGKLPAVQYYCGVTPTIYRFIQTQERRCGIFIMMINKKESVITYSALVISVIIVLQLLLAGTPSCAIDMMPSRDRVATETEFETATGVPAAPVHDFTPRDSRLFAEDGASADAEEVYVYAIVIEFGSFSFYYDYGVWDPATLTYKADPASSDPSHSTVEGSPGWYGFDGISNKITVKNASLDESEGQKLSDLKITISYSQAEFSQTVRDSVKMTLFTDAAFLKKHEGINPDGSYSFTIPSGTDPSETDPSGTDPSETENVVVVFVSLSGTPSDSQGNDIFSDVAIPIGYITLQVSIPEPEG